MATVKQLIKYPVVLFVGVPGSGKTTLCAAIARYCNKHNIDVYSNVEINNTFQIEKADIGSCLIEDGVLLFDEAGVDLNGRSWKQMSYDMIRYLKEVRHFNVRSLWFSQDLDMDATIRRLASIMFIVRRSRIPGFVTAVPVRAKYGIDDYTHQLTKMYYLSSPLWQFFSNVRIFAPRYYKDFDSWSRYDLPTKDFSYYEIQRDIKKRVRKPIFSWFKTRRHE